MKSWIQLDLNNASWSSGCELLWIMYLWKVEYNLNFLYYFTFTVVNCFELCIFEKLNTTTYTQIIDSYTLWIALNYVSLKSWIQRKDLNHFRIISCELLWIMYLWKVEYNTKTNRWFTVKLWIALNYVSLKSWIQPKPPIREPTAVVNCFELCIFEKLNTTVTRHRSDEDWLWIALNYVSLKSWIQLLVKQFIWTMSCELLWIMYLWKVEYNPSLELPMFRFVVNCFELCIFEKLNTTHYYQ